MLRPPIPVGNRIIMRPDRAMHLVVNTNLGAEPTATVPCFGHTDVIVNWGDGTRNHFKQPGYYTHTYKQHSTYDIRIRGRLHGFGVESGGVSYPNVEKIVTCKSFGQLKLESLRLAFGSGQVDVNIVEVPEDLPNSVKSLLGTFYRATLLNCPNLINWNTSNINNVSSCFRQCHLFNQPIGGWDVSKVTTTQSLFNNALSFNQDIGDWDVSNVETMAAMFVDAPAFNKDISRWNVSNVTYMGSMFLRAAAFNNGEEPGVDNLGIGIWNVNSLGIGFTPNSAAGNMFTDAESFNQDLSGWCVQHVSSAPSNFTTGATSWNTTNRLPVWGTCTGE